MAVCCTIRTSRLLIQSFTAQPEAPAETKAGAFGWAVNKDLASVIRLPDSLYDSVPTLYSGRVRLPGHCDF